MNTKRRSCWETDALAGLHHRGRREWLHVLLGALRDADGCRIRSPLGCKAAVVQENGVLPVEEVRAEGALVVTEDDEKGGFDSAAVHQKIKELFG